MVDLHLLRDGWPAGSVSLVAVAPSALRRKSSSCRKLFLLPHLPHCRFLTFLLLSRLHVPYNFHFSHSFSALLCTSRRPIYNSHRPAISDSANKLWKARSKAIFW